MNYRLRTLGLFIALFCLSVFAEETVHIVQRGETVYSIARRYGVRPEEVLTLNGIGDPRTLQAGQRLRIPQSEAPGRTEDQALSVSSFTAPAYTEHRVSRGETLYGIARRYGLSLEALRSANNLSGDSVLREGAVLRIPAVPGDRNPESVAAAVNPPAEGADASDSARQTVPRTVDESIRWPVNARELSYMTSKLYGVVLVGEHAEPVRSLTQGTVVSTGPYRGYGKVAIIQRTGGYLYVYGGCESLTVKEGDRVNPGTEVGKLGIDAVSNKPQLFFLVYQNNSPIDPAKAPRL
jgi:murein DD-endopeptidase MepM/ murein hydrolase activator NlpD